MDRLLFGDNQFFGVSHMSEEKARAQTMRFQSLHAVIEVLDAAYDAGVHTFMCTTHERVAQVCDHVRAHPERNSEFVFYPCMPMPISTRTPSQKTACSARSSAFFPTRVSWTRRYVAVLRWPGRTPRA